MDIAKIRKKIKEEKASDLSQKKASSHDASTETAEKNGVSLQETIPSKPKNDIQKIEKSRSEPPAKPQYTKKETGKQELVELLTFYLTNEEFAFRLSDIEEILRYQIVTFVPRTPAYVQGITSLRGKIIPVVDLIKRLSIAGESANTDARRKVLILRGEKGLFGVLVDKIKGVIRVLPSEIKDPPSHLSENEQIFIEGVLLYENKFVSVLKLSEILDAGLKSGMSAQKI